MIGHSRDLAPSIWRITDQPNVILKLAPMGLRPLSSFDAYAALKALALVLAADEVSAKFKSRTRSKSKSQKQRTEVSVPLELCSTHAPFHTRSGKEHCESSGLGLATAIIEDSLHKT